MLATRFKLKLILYRVFNI